MIWIAIVWIVTGNAIVFVVMDKEMRKDFYLALVATILWPLVFVAQIIRWNNSRREENARQERITRKVLSGEYTLEDARRLQWKGVKVNGRWMQV